jgi:hypothetical protein
MPTDIGQRLQAFRLARDTALRVTAGIAVQLPKEGKLNIRTIARTPTVIRTEVAFTCAVHVHRIIPVALGCRAITLQTSDRIWDVLGLQGTEFVST